MANEVARKVGEEKAREDDAGRRAVEGHAVNRSPKQSDGADEGPEVHPQYRDIYSGMLNYDGLPGASGKGGEQQEEEDLEATIRPRTRFRANTALWERFGEHSGFVVGKEGGAREGMEMSPPPAYAA